MTPVIFGFATPSLVADLDVDHVHVDVRFAVSSLAAPDTIDEISRCHWTNNGDSRLEEQWRAGKLLAEILRNAKFINRETC